MLPILLFDIILSKVIRIKKKKKKSRPIAQSGDIGSKLIKGVGEGDLSRLEVIRANLEHIRANLKIFGQI